MNNFISFLAESFGIPPFLYDICVGEGDVTTSYTYDSVGQLIRVDDPQENATWVYEYVQGGNILSKKKYALGNTSGTLLESKIFTYGNSNWKDQLTAVNGIGSTYDAIGNPLNDGTWQNGHQLKKMEKSGETVEFVYNENGLRVQKTATSTGVTQYTLHGKTVVHMTQGSNELHFFYDAQNKPAVVVYNGSPYSYVKNLQGDIVAIIDSSYAIVVRYKYDAWGCPISCTGSMADAVADWTDMGINVKAAITTIIPPERIIDVEPGHNLTKYILTIEGAGAFKQTDTYCLTLCDAGIHEPQYFHAPDPFLP